MRVSARRTAEFCDCFPWKILFLCKSKNGEDHSITIFHTRGNVLCKNRQSFLLSISAGEFSIFYFRFQLGGNRRNFLKLKTFHGGRAKPSWKVFWKKTFHDLRGRAGKMAWKVFGAYMWKYFFSSSWLKVSTFCDCQIWNFRLFCCCCFWSLERYEHFWKFLLSVVFPSLFSFSRTTGEHFALTYRSPPPTV